MLKKINTPITKRTKTKTKTKINASGKIYNRAINEFNTATEDYQFSICRDVSSTIECTQIDYKHSTRLIDHVLNICPTIDLTNIARDINKLDILRYLSKVDIKKSIDYNTLFDAAMNDNNIKLAVFAIQHGATIWNGFDEDMYTTIFIKSGAGKILDAIPEKLNYKCAAKYHKHRNSICKLIKSTNLLIDIIQIVLTYLPYEIPDLTPNEWVVMKNKANKKLPTIIQDVIQGLATNEE